MSRILFATSEALPLIKTGGLGDVSGSLPVALNSSRHNVRLILPAYSMARRQAGDLKEVAKFEVPSAPAHVRLLEGTLPGSTLPIWLIDCPPLFDRPGGPYADQDGTDWYDNAQRFGIFCRAVSIIAMGQIRLNWKPDVVHCNDWQCGLIPPLIASQKNRPATVFTIHNLSYQGLFSQKEFFDLQLPPELWSMNGVEFHGHFSFIKGGLATADMLSTVSPTYAKEIRTPQFGYGLEGLLEHRVDRLMGILNGVDYALWDPKNDPYIIKPYTSKTIRFKSVNKSALQEHMGLPASENTPLIGVIGRMVEQKGFDLLLANIDPLIKSGVQLVVLGSGEPHFEEAFKAAATQYPQNISVQIGYDETLAHHIESGSDMFLMPSRFEPSGLNQLYSLRYGTVPIVHHIGGLADSVVDASEENQKAKTATGFVFNEPTPASLLTALQRAIALYKQPKVWKQLMKTGMKQDFSWKQSAKQYSILYQRAIQYSQQ
ncbi:MAG: glycogen synthase GlgA [Gammaproteobacteria bacterium]|nr:glycogen synthase GlgA [Gammaproteobacteria bacterium]